MFESITRFDLSVLDMIHNSLSCGLLDRFFIIVSGLMHDGLLCMMLALVLFIIPKTRKTGLCMAFAMVFGFVFGNLIIKNAVARIRPYEFRPGIELLVSKLKDYSFPSGHTLVSFEAATVLAVREKKRFGIPALVFAAVVAFSRLYLYVHYPTDVIAGIVLGVLFGLAGCYIGGTAYGLVRDRQTGEKRN